MYAAAQQSGVINVGDVLVSIDGNPILDLNELVTKCATLDQATFTFAYAPEEPTGLRAVL